MRRTLKILLIVQLVLGVPWVFLAAAANGPGGLAIVGLFFLLYAIFAVMFMVAAYACWRYPAERTLAVWIIVLPVVLWMLPNVARSLYGGAVPADQNLGLIAMISLSGLAACWIFPRRVARFIPDLLLQSRAFNWVILLSIVAAWVFLFIAALYLYTEPSYTSDGAGMKLAYGLLLGAIYLAGLGAGSFGASTWAWISLRSGASVRRLNIAQFVAAAPGIAIGVGAVVWLTSQS